MMDYQVTRLGHIASTNDYALELINQGDARDKTVIIASHQTSGRGIDQNFWESEADKNLTLSVILFPDYLSASDQFYISKAVSLGLYQLLRHRLGDAIKIKWPNDFLFKKKKIAGILIQNGIQDNDIIYCIAGIGLNVNQERFSENAGNPISLKMASGKEYNLEILLGELMESIDFYLEMVKSGQIEELDTRYLSALFRFEEEAEYIYKGQKIRAVITGVRRSGQLRLSIPHDKIVECDMKEIKFML
jgi:BirA family biotin operon repressor/biotin-[acetyl-CoA-carboxylase] ligase